jgi:hypothetical protein
MCDVLTGKQDCPSCYYHLPTYTHQYQTATQREHSPMQDKGHSMGKVGSKQSPASGVVRVGPLMGMPAVLRELGVDVDAIFASTGLTSAQF